MTAGLGLKLKSSETPIFSKPVKFSHSSLCQNFIRFSPSPSISINFSEEAMERLLYSSSPTHFTKTQLKFSPFCSRLAPIDSQKLGFFRSSSSESKRVSSVSCKYESPTHFSHPSSSELNDSHSPTPHRVDSPDESMPSSNFLKQIAKGTIEGKKVIFFLILNFFSVFDFCLWGFFISVK